jgi:hypothetical protein
MREIRDGKSIHGTAYELGNRKQVEDYFEGSIELGLGNHPTLSFLRDSMSAII